MTETIDGRTLEGQRYESLPPITYENSLDTIRAHASEIITELVYGRVDKHFKSVFTIKDIPDLSQQATFVCEGVLPLLDQETLKHQGKTKGIRLPDADGLEKEVYLLENHYHALKTLVFSHVIDELLDDPTTSQVAQGNDTWLFLRKPLIYALKEARYISDPAETGENSLESPKTTDVNELFEVFTHVLFNRSEGGRQEYVRGTMDLHRVGELNEVTLDYKDMEDLLLPLTQQAPNESKRLEIFKRNWLNMALVGLINTGYQYTTQNSDNLQQPLKQDIGITPQNQIIKMIKELNPFFTREKIIPLIDEIPMEIWLSFGSAVLGMFYAYGEYGVDEDELMAYNCVLGAMVHYNNRSLEKANGMILVDRRRTRDYMHMIDDFKRTGIPIQPSKQPRLSQFRDWISAVTQTLEEEIYAVSLDDKLQTNPLTLHYWKANILGHLLFTIGLGSHSYENMPSYPNDLTEDVEYWNLTYSALDEVPNEKIGKTRPDGWKAVFDIPVNAIYRMLENNSSAAGLTSQEHELLMAIKQILQVPTELITKILYADIIYPKPAFTKDEAETARLIFAILNKIHL